MSPHANRAVELMEQVLRSSPAHDGYRMEAARMYADLALAEAITGLKVSTVEVLSNTWGYTIRVNGARS